MNGKWITIKRMSKLRYWTSHEKLLSSPELHSLLNDTRNNTKHEITVRDGIIEPPTPLEVAILKEQDLRAALNVIVQDRGMDWVQEQIKTLRSQ